jgi:hypothetical protein
MSKILAAGDDGSFSNFKVLIVSTDAGVTWAKVTTALTDSGWAIHWAPSLSLWACGTNFASSTDQVQTSPDGASGNWTAQTSPADHRAALRITSGGGLLVSVYQGAGAIKIMTSPDGVTWTDRPVPATVLSIPSNADITYSSDLGLFVVADVQPATSSPPNFGAVITSPDGITWTLRYKQSVMGGNYALAWGNGIFVLIGGPQGSGEHLYTSTDGITWTFRSNPGGSAQGWDGVHFANGRFIAVSADTFTNAGKQAAYSTDGINWTIVSTPGTNKKWSAVTYDSGTWVAAHGGTGTTQSLMVSTDDGVTWSLITTSFSYGFMNGIASDFQPPAASFKNCWDGMIGSSVANAFA